LIGLYFAEIMFVTDMNDSVIVYYVFCELTMYLCVVSTLKDSE